MVSSSYEVLKVDALERGPAMVDQGTRASHRMVVPTKTKKMMMKVLGAQRKELRADRESEITDQIVRDEPPKGKGSG